ncbi:MAG: hypothetical protein RR619_06805 [Raoultibacter sp.]
MRRDSVWDYISPVILYDNPAGSNETISLSESVATFGKLEIFFRDNDGYYNDVKVDRPNGKMATLDIPFDFHAAGAVKTGTSAHVGTDGVIEMYCTNDGLNYWGFSVTYVV